MIIDLIANELSFQAPAPDRNIAVGRVDDFIDTILEMRVSGVKGKLRTHVDFYLSPLADRYSLADWMVDSTVDLDRRRFLRTLATGGPFLADLHDVEERQRGCEFYYGDIRSVGLGAAYLTDSPAVSLLSDPLLDTPMLSVRLEELTESSEIQGSTIDIRHASLPKHAAVHADWVKRRVLEDVADGPALWRQRIDLFPGLQFCEMVEAQLHGLQPGAQVHQVLRRLQELDSYSRGWTGGPFTNAGLSNSSEESNATLSHPTYGPARVFPCPDGSRATFSWHMKIMAFNLRIHFLPQPSHHDIIIGYIGPHLPTPRFH